MPRIRTIKPEFFLNDKMAELKPLERIFFIGLWTQADRSGRLEDRPKRLKAALLPYDNLNIEKALENLSNCGFIYRYSENDCKYIEILTFLKHQYPNIKEPDSIIPAPSSYDTSIPRLRKGKERKGKERNKNICDIGDKTADDCDNAFENFWKEYPSRNGKKLLKAEAEKIFAKIKNGDIELIMQAVRNYANSKGCRNGYAKDAIRFLRSNFWRDWLEPEKLQGGQDGGSERFTKAGGIKSPVGKYDGLEIQENTGSDKSGKL